MFLNELNAGVIGLGSMGQHHARHYFNFHDVNLVAVSDIDKSKIEIAKKYNCKFYINYKDMLRKEDLDIVSIAVPTSLHEKIAVDVLNKGIHVLIEKPISYDLRSAKKILKTAEKNKTMLMVGHVERFNPVIRKLKELIKKGKFGEIVSIESKRLSIYHPRIRDCGVIIDLGIHDIDLINFLFNWKVKSIYATALHKFIPNPNFEDHANIILNFENNAIGKIEVSWISPTKVREITLIGSKNCCKVYTLQQKIEIIESFLEVKNNLTWQDYPEFIKKFEPKVKILQEENVEPLQVELREFVDAVKLNKPVPVSGEEAFKALEIAIKAIRSYKTRKIIFA
ncbi:MAG: Gfo/Idh/MocA family oxidoreductase [Candidatus Aenigmatarchaeota archaeon]